MKRRAVAIVALALPAVIVGLVATVLLGRSDEGSRACPTLDVALGEPAGGPRGWMARGRYEQWPEGGQCLGSLGVSLFAPGESWEDEAWSPAAHVIVRHGLLPPPTREQAFLAWGDDGRPMLFGFGHDAAPLVVDALPDAPRGVLVRRCEVIEGVRSDGVLDWSRVASAGDDGECVRLPVE
jgi:hypothetical protein